ncbi:MAG TPA: GNAT family N-acetyltransferase [Acidimicrobiales bacterium]|nr:GNAT family N-acetyltransferase [Acidimicrobiales bacterium]
MGTVQTARIDEVDPRQYSDGEIAELHELQVELDKEAHPEDPPVSLRAFSWTARNLPEEPQFSAWWARDGAGHLIGVIRTHTYPSGTNSHAMDVWLQVRPVARRQGIGRELLRHAAERAGAEGKTLITGWTNERVAAGAEFCRSVGAEVGYAEHINRLLLAELDPELLQEWVEDGRRRAGEDYELIGFDRRCPDDLADAVLEAFEVMADAPREGMHTEHRHMTLAEMRNHEQRALAVGAEVWCLFPRERRTGRLVGVTNVWWQPDHPQLVAQGDTGVVAAHRGRGLGKWLKAAMLQRILAERSEATEVRTGNADSNGPMLSINHRLGFRPYIASAAWQVEVEALRRALAAPDV